MCFSANASFGAGVILTIAGATTSNKIKVSSQKPFAAIPYIFAAQQFTEGFVWLSLNNSDLALWQKPATYAFLVFAQVFWPIWVPYSIMKLENDKKRKNILISFMAVGAMVSGYLAYCLFVYPVNSEIVEYHIHYTLSFPLSIMPISGLIYFIPTVISPFVSSIKRMPILGIAILGSYLFTLYYFKEYVISIWCFLAAVLSILIFMILSSQQKEANMKVLA